MKAMIFAAGLGTRLSPLTNDKPKALVEIAGKTMLQRTIEQLVFYGFNDIIVNIHHFPGKMKKAIASYKSPKYKITISDESNELLDTAGGLFHAKSFFDDGKDFLVHNVDVISDINLLDLYNFHLKHKALATLAVRDRKTSRYFLFDHKTKLLCGWKNIKDNKEIVARENFYNLVPLAFSGIQVINPRIFRYKPNKKIFSMTDLYLELAPYQDIIAFKHNESQWFDIGTVEKLKQAEQYYHSDK